MGRRPGFKHPGFPHIARLCDTCGIEYTKRGTTDNWCGPCATQRRTDRQRRYNAEKRYAGRFDYRLDALRKYGMNHQDYAAMLEGQGAQCAICHSDKPHSPGRKHFSVDHCHATGVVRGLLCVPCNTKLGVVEDWYFKNQAKIDAYRARVHSPERLHSTPISAGVHEVF